MKDTTTQEQLKALADNFMHGHWFRSEITPDERRNLKSAARHLRAYAQQIASSCTLAEAVREAHIQKALVDQSDARIKELEACCAEMRILCEAALGCLSEGGSNKQYDSSWIRPRTLSRQEVNSACEQAYHVLNKVLAGHTDCGKDLLAQHEAWRKALSAIWNGDGARDCLRNIARQALNPPVSEHTPDK